MTLKQISIKNIILKLKNLIMENKINIAEILKDCPKGMELDCVMFENVTFEGIKHDEYPIIVKIKEPPMALSLTKTGGWNLYNSAKCVIFPKGKTTWEGFQRPFKDGDVVISNHGDIHINRDNLSSYCCLRRGCFDATITTLVKFDRLATEEEKQKLFDAIKDNGYKWNEETKTLEKLVKPKFKVGDRVKKKDSNEDVVLITDIADNYYIVETKYGMEATISISIQNDYELVPNKFDITTLKPFESKVLVRDTVKEPWKPDFFGCLYGGNNCPYSYMVVGGIRWKCCIPYEGNEHLLGTTNDCDEFYKTW